MTARIQKVLSWYRSENPGTLTNLYRMLSHGRLAGAADYAGEVPLVLKLNSHDVLHSDPDPLGALTGSVEDALRLGCVAVGHTIYPGSMDRRLLYEQARELILEAKSVSLVAVLWSYPRSGELSKEGETVLDVVAYSTHIAAQLSAHVIKVKLPTDHVEFDAVRTDYDSGIARGSLADRVAHVVQSTFAGRRVVIFSGGAKVGDDEAIVAEARAIRDGGGFGSIIGRNSFQRPRDGALELLERIMHVYAA